MKRLKKIGEAILWGGAAAAIPEAAELVTIVPYGQQILSAAAVIAAYFRRQKPDDQE